VAAAFGAAAPNGATLAAGVLDGAAVGLTVAATVDWAADGAAEPNGDAATFVGAGDVGAGA
jgi:hypothetical protein